MPSPRRLLGVLVLAAWALGLLPPAAAAGVPPTVIRTVSLDEARLVPDGGAVALAPGGLLRASSPTWSAPVETCSPIRFTTVGFVWGQDGDARVRARVATGEAGRFGRAWRVVADPDEGPDPGSPDDAGVEGTPPVWTGEATCARVRLRLPAKASLSDVRAVFVNTSGTAEEPSFLDRAGDLLAGAWGLIGSAEPAAAMTSPPSIITRAGWGASEKLRRCGPDYAPAVKMAYVHHTVNGNGYGAQKADDIVRAIYAYHTRGRGYCDIAYNFLVDRFGRIYEGRAGGMDQPVIGAHAMGFNTGSVGVAGIGTYSKSTPKGKMLTAFRRLLAWRLDVAHVRPTGRTTMTSAGGPNQKFDKGEEVPLPVIAGHRDTGYTTCPGGRLYQRIGPIRSGAEAIGLPKIWDPLATPSVSYPGQPIRFTATLSTSMAWTVDIVNAYDGTPVKQLAGTGWTVDATWDRTDATGFTQMPAGSYLAYVRATAPSGGVAWEARLPITLY